MSYTGKSLTMEITDFNQVRDMQIYSNERECWTFHFDRKWDEYSDNKSANRIDYSRKTPEWHFWST